ncbi:MAG: hypothetical protein IT361_07340 [Gemmatimonadaceae bacterium]|nr:hypothetical protein [Gemmatimonadaceae bacterium]
MIIPPQHPSTHTKALADRLQATIAEYRASQPKATDLEVHAAVQTLVSPSANAARTGTAIAATILVAIGVVFMVVASIQGAQRGRAVPWLVLGAILVPALALLGVLWKRTLDD